MKHKKVAILATTLLVTAGGAAWHYAASEFEKIVHYGVEDIQKTTTLQFGSMTLSKYFFKVAIKDISFSFPKTEFSPQGTMGLHEEFEIRFNPFTKTTTLRSNSLESQMDIELGAFKETILSTDTDKSFVAVITHRKYPKSNMDFIEQLKTISTFSVARGQTQIRNTKGELLMSFQAANGEGSWNMSDDRKLTVALNSQTQGFTLDTQYLLELIKRASAEFTMGEEARKRLAELDQLNMSIPKNQKTAVSLAIDYDKAWASFEKGLKNLSKEDLPDANLKLAHDSQTEGENQDWIFDASFTQKQQRFNIEGSFETTSPKEELASRIIQALEEEIGKEKFPLAINREAFIKGFPDFAKMGRINYGLYLDGNFIDTIKIDKARLIYKTKDFGIEAKGSLENERVAADIILTNYRTIVDGIASLSQRSIEAFILYDVNRKLLDIAIPLYQKTAFTVIEKIGEPKPTKNDVTFRIEGTLSDFSINGKKLAELLPLIMAS